MDSLHNKPEQEPVAKLKLMMEESAFEGRLELSDALLNIEQFYTTPPQRTWVELTDEQKHQLNQSLNLQGRFPIIDAIEAICKGNNT